MAVARRALSRGLVAVAAGVTLTATVPPASAGFTSTTSSSGVAATAKLAAPATASASRGSCVPAVSRQVNVSWSATSSAFADGYDVKRATANGGPYTSITTVALGTTSYTDPNVSGSTTYYYVVESNRQSWRSADSPQASVTTPNAVTCL